MLAIVRRAAGKQEKPSVPVRGYASRLPWAWNALVFAVPFHQESYEGLYDIANNCAPLSLTGGTWVSDSRGNPALRLGSGEWIEYPDHPRHDIPSRELTVYVRCKRNGTPENGAPLVANIHSNVAEPWMTWSMGSRWMDNTHLAGATTSGAQPTVEVFSTTTPPTTEHTAACLRVRDGEASTLSIVGERGQFLETATNLSVTVGDLVYGAGKSIRVNRSEDDLYHNTADYSQILVWSRKLSDVEMAAIMQDPFGWYSPRRETVVIASPFPIVAAPASSVTVGGRTSIVPNLTGDVPTSYDVTASPNADAIFTRTVSGVDTSETVTAGSIVNFTTGATVADDVTFIGLRTDDSGV